MRNSAFNRAVKLDRQAFLERHRPPWFRLGLLGLLLFSLALRFWGLGRFNMLVFDEVYFPKFASHYLKGIPLFEGHPPLSTYILAIGIWIADHTPIGASPVKNDWSGLFLAPISYRWLDALVGSFIPIVTAAIAYELSHRRSFALLAGLFVAVDGLFLVESRYGLINVFLVLFGLLGHWLLLAALNRDPNRRGWWLIGAGIFLGAAPAVKWNGLGYLLGVYLLLTFAWGLRIWNVLKRREVRSPTGSIAPSNPLQNLTQIHPVQAIATLGLIPALTYYLSWLPYLRLTPGVTFLQWQSRIIDYHHRVGGMDAHPYCSRWYSWVFMLRPIAYFYKTSHGLNEPPPIVGPPLPVAAERAIYDVHAMGNPVLWWFTVGAIALLIALLVARAIVWLRQRPVGVEDGGTWTALYIIVNWMANLLPWVSVTRCVFIYHYMGAVLFAFMALAFVIDRWLSSPRDWQRILGLTAVFLILIAFVYWLPMFLGLPMTPEAVMARRWLRSWI